MTVAVSTKRKIETAVYTLATQNADIAELVAGGSVWLKEAHDFDETTKGCSIVVSVENQQNAGLGATGLGACWNAQLVMHIRQAVAKDKTRNLADKALGAAERFLAGLTASTLTTALTSDGVTVYGVTAGEVNTGEILGEREAIAHATAITLHYSVS